MSVSEFRKDPVTGRWVIVSTERHKRMSDFRRGPVVVTPDPSCPFCEGHEHMTPGEIYASRNGTQANAAGWDVRVVPNQFPALRVEGSLDRRGEGMFDKMNGIGAHEVIIESPKHDETLATMDEAAVERVLWAFRERVLDLKRDTRFRYIIIFKNYGAAAGATLSHSYSQLIALPVVPRVVLDELEGSKAHYQAKERCVFCDIVRQEGEDGRRVVVENADMIAVAPYAPRFPFETWILPKRHQARYEDAPRHEYRSLARLIGDVLSRMNRALETPPYSLLVHSAPFGKAADYYHWHIEIIPKLSKLAGFESATGFYLNPTGPEEAAQVLRDFSG